MHEKFETSHEEGYFSDRTTKSSFNISFNGVSSPSPEKQPDRISLWDVDIDYQGVNFLFDKGILIERIQEAHKTIDNLRIHINNYEEEMNNLKEKNQHLLEELEKDRNEKTEIYKQINEKEDVSKNLSCVTQQLTLLIDTQKNMTEKNEALKTSNYQYQNRLQEKEEAILTADKKISHLTSELNSLNTKYTALLNDQSNLTNKLNIILVEKENLIKEYQHIHKLFCGKETEVQKLESELQNSQDKMIKFEKKSRDLEEQIFKLKRESSFNKTDMQENLKLCKENEDLLKKIDSYKNELNNKCLQLEKFHKELESRNIVISRKDEQLKVFELNLMQLRAENSNTNAELYRLEKLNEELSINLCCSHEQMEFIKGEKVRMIEKLKNICKNYKKLRDDHSKLTEKIDTLSYNNRTLLIESSSTNEQLKRCKSEIEQLTKDIEHLKNLNKTINDEKQNFIQTQKEKVETLTKEKDLVIEEKQTQLDELLASISENQETTTGLKKHAEQLQNEKNILNSKVTELKSELQNLENIQHEEYINFKESRQKFLEEQGILQNAKKCLEVDIQKLKQEISLLQKELHERQEKWNLEKFELNCKSNDLIKAKEEELSQSQISLNLLKNEKKKLLIKIEKIKIDNTDLLSQLEETRNEVLKLKDQLEIQTDKMNELKINEQQKYQSILNEKSMLENQLKEHLSTIHSLQHDNLQVKNELKKIEKVQQTENSKLFNLQQKYENQREEIDRLNVSLKQAQEKTLKTKHDFESQRENISAKLSASNKQIKSLTVENNKKEIQIDSLNKQLKKFQTKNSDLTQELEIIKEVNNQLENMNQKLQHDLKKLNEDLKQSSDDLKELKFSYEELLSKELSKQKTEFLYKENQLLKQLACSKQ